MSGLSLPDSVRIVRIGDSNLTSVDPHTLAQELEAFVERSVARMGDTTARDPGHRIPFRWPPPAISKRYLIHDQDWVEHGEFVDQGEVFPVQIARTLQGTFARSVELWAEARGQDRDLAIQHLRETCAPLLARQRMTAACLEQSGRFSGSIAALGPLDLLKLLYCPQRDVGHEAQVAIEAGHDRHFLFPALLVILRDRRHPYRRAAQWAVLDLFEDLPSFCSTEQSELEAIRTMRDLVWEAEDDICRVVYKAGVVLGGQVPHSAGGDALLECLNSPSPIGRRSAIHGLFHVVEWQPERRDEVVEALRRHAASESHPQLREFALAMTADIEHRRLDHVAEPIFDSDRVAPPAA